MYRMLSAGNLVVSPLKVFAAIAFQSEMTAGSLAPETGGSAVAGTAAKLINRPAAAKAASQLRVGVLRDCPFMSRPSPPGVRCVTVISPRTAGRCQRHLSSSGLV